MMSNFVISVKDASERRKHIHETFSAEQIDYHFFDAISHQELEKIAQEIGVDVTQSTLKKNEISCLLSHLYLWKKAAEGDQEYITIFEDDIHLGVKSHLFLSSYDWIPQGCEIVKLEYFYPHIGIDRKKSHVLDDGRSLIALMNKHLGCGGYIISKKAAHELLNFVRNHAEVLPVDHYIFNFFLLKGEITTYQMYPALCIQDHKLKDNRKNFSSHLLEDRQIRKGEGQYKVQLAFGAKIKKEALRVFGQLTSMFKNKKNTLEIIEMKFK